MRPVGKSDSFRARAQHPAGAARNNGTKVEGNGRRARDGSPAAGFRKVPREQRPFDFL
jgi:hypothetical protein